MTELERRKNDGSQMTKASTDVALWPLYHSSFVRHSSFQPSFIKFDQIEISPDIFAAFAAGLFEKM